MHKCRPSSIVAGALLSVTTVAAAASAQNTAGFTDPFPPFRIAGNLYYVGSKGLANYLITTPQGHILINSDLEANVPMIARERREARVQVRGHQDSPDQPRALGPRRRQRHDQASDRREVHGHGRRRAGCRIRRQDRLSVRKRQDASLRRRPRSIAFSTTATRSSSATPCSSRISRRATRRGARRGR